MKKWISFFLFLVVAMMCSEAFLRIYPSRFRYPKRIRYSNEDGIGISLVKNYYTQQYNPCYGWSTITTNSFGMRDRERTIKKSPQKRRIAFLGNSQLEAVQVYDHQTFTRLLENNRREALNFGIAGIGTVQEEILYEKKVRRFHPDEVVLLFNLNNDLTFSSMALGHVLYTGKLFLSYRDNNGTIINEQNFGKIKALKQEAIDRSALARLIFSRIVESAPKQFAVERQFAEEGQQSSRAQTIYEEEFLVPPDNDWEESWKSTEHALVRLKKEVEKDGISLIVLVPPTGHTLEEFATSTVYRTIQNGRTIDLAYPQKRLVSILQKNGIRFIETPPPENYGCDLHWDAKGQRQIADFIDDKI